MRYRLNNTAQGVAIMIIWWKQWMFDRSWSVMLMMFYLNAIHFPALKKMWTSSKSPKYCIFHDFHVFCNVNLIQKSQVLNFFYWMFHLCSGLTEYARNLNLKWKMGLIFVWLTWSLKATLWHRLIVCLFVFNIKEPTLFSVSVNSPTWPGHEFQRQCCRPLWLFAWAVVSYTIFLLVQVVL